ncbi:Peroxiredoxin 1 [Diplonema papillatum]|nr:Peroxiredoxin 1 [Diplonema papillatum]
MMMRAAWRSSVSAARRYCSSLPSVLTTRQAPLFEAEAVVNGEITNVNMKDYEGKYLVLFFYPLDFTFVCPTEIIAFNDRAKEFEAIGCNVAAVSVDSAFSHLAWSNMPRNKGGLGKMQIPLIADLDKSIARNYGVLLNNSVALRGLFVIDGKGVVRSTTVNDLPVGRSVDETLRIVKAFQYTDEHGDVMPCNWEPGQDTMKADPVGSQEYFSKSA